MLHRRPALRDATTTCAVPVIEKCTETRGSKLFLRIAVRGVSAQPSTRGEQRLHSLNCELRTSRGRGDSDTGELEVAKVCWAIQIFEDCSILDL